MPSVSELHARYPYIAPLFCSSPRGFDFPLLSLSFPLRYAFDQFHLNSAAFRALDQSRLVTQLYNMQVAAVENSEDEASLLLAAYDYLAAECQKVDPLYAQEVLDDLVTLHNGQLEGEHKQALIHINTSVVTKDSYSSVFSVYTDDRTDASRTNAQGVSSLTHVDQFAIMSGPHIHSPLRLRSVLGAPNPKNISALVFKVIVVIIATKDKAYALLLPQTPAIEMSSRHLREFGSRHFLRVEFVIPRASSMPWPQRCAGTQARVPEVSAPDRVGPSVGQRRYKLHKIPIIAEEKIQRSIARAGFSLAHRRFARASHSPILKRAIYNILTTGIYLGGSLFIYYAQGSGQLKEQQCWFIRAPDYEIMYKSMRHFASFIKEFKYYQSFYADVSSRLYFFYVQPVLPSIEYLDSALNAFLRPRAVLFREFAISWLGDIKEIQACKICTRRGLCFGKSLPTITIREEDVRVIPDEQHGSYVFTDGAGEISYDFMLEIALCLDKVKHEQLGKDSEARCGDGSSSTENIDVDEYFGDTEDAVLHLQPDPKLASNSIQVPSAVQMRWAGAKGVLVLNALLPPRTILLRNSQVKFSIRNPTETQQTLEILRVAQPSKGMINMQIIVLLSEMGVPDDVFLNFVHQDLQKALVFLDPADRCTRQSDLYQLINRVSRSSSGKLILQMLMAGVDTTEPCLQFILMRLQMMQLHSMKANMRFSVPDSRILVGVYDCFGLLKEGEIYIGLHEPMAVSKWVALTHLNAISDSMQRDASASDSLQLQLADLAIERGASCVEGRVVVAKNPCFYRGDVRVYQGVDIFERLKRRASEENLTPALPPFVAREAIKAMYRGVICFPKHYEGRPMTDCLSGSDLDGDIYWVSWDSSLLGTIRHEYEPASFQPWPGEVDKSAPNLNDIEMGLGNLLRNEAGVANGVASNWPSLQELKQEQFYNLSYLFRKNYISAVLKDQCSRGVDLQSKKMLYSETVMKPVELILTEAFILEWVSSAFFDKTIGKIGSELKIVGDILGYSHPLTIELGRQFFFAIDADKTGWRRRAASSASRLLTLSLEKLYQSSREEAKRDYLSESSDLLSDCSNMLDEVTHYAADAYTACLSEIAGSISTGCNDFIDPPTSSSGKNDSSQDKDRSLRFIFSDSEDSDGSVGEPRLKMQSPQQISLKQGLEQELRESSLVNTISSQHKSEARVRKVNKRISLQQHSYKMKQDPSERKNVATGEDTGCVSTRKTKISLPAIADAHAILTQIIKSRKATSQASNQSRNRYPRSAFPVSRASIMPNWMLGSATTGLLYPTDSDWFRLRNKIVYHSQSVVGSIYNLITSGEGTSVGILRKCVGSNKKPFFQAVVDTLRPISAILPSNLARVRDSIEKSMAVSLSSLSIDLSQLTEFSAKDSLMLLGIQTSTFQRQIDISVHIFGSVIADFNSLSQRGRLHADTKGSAYSRMVSLYSSQMRKGVSDEERRARAVILYYLFYTYALVQLLPTIQYCEQVYGPLSVQDIYSDSRLQTKAKTDPDFSVSSSSDLSSNEPKWSDETSCTSSSEYRPENSHGDRGRTSGTAPPPPRDCQARSSCGRDSNHLLTQYIDSISVNCTLIGIQVSPDDHLAWSKHAGLPSYKAPVSPSIVLCNRYSATGIVLSAGDDYSSLGGFSSIPVFSEVSTCLKSLTRKKISVLPPILALPQHDSNESGIDKCVAHHISVAKLVCNWPVSMVIPTTVFSRPNSSDNTLRFWENTWKSFIKAQLTLLQAEPQDLQEVPISALTRQTGSSESHYISIFKHPSKTSDAKEALCRVHCDLAVKASTGGDVMILQEQLNDLIGLCTGAIDSSRNSTLSSSYSFSDDNPSTVFSENTPVLSEQDESVMELISENSSSCTGGSSSKDSTPYTRRPPIAFQKLRPKHAFLPTGKLSIKDSHSGIDVLLKPIFFTRNSLLKITESPNLKSSRFTRSYTFIQKKYINALQICRLVWDICSPELCEAFARCRHQYIHAVNPELISFVSVRSKNG